MAAHFEKTCSVISNGVVPVNKYRSTRTGLQVFIAQVEGPLVNGFFCLATEAHDDDGLPHTLEHLIFLGSEKYPYKGVLDMLANRCLAQGTNAWTDTDHTCYTVMTAGSQGFLNLLPIYLDHVLYPTLTDAGYVTEVHHVNGEGEDAGVVYCEMQARENSGESRSHLAMLRAMYPGHCGYKSETGGIMSNLRTSTSNAKVRQYHKDFYRPDNLCLIITGQVTPEEVFKALEPFEEKIMAKGALSPYVRPWQTPVPPLTESVVQTMPFPSDDEANGMVYMAWRAPKAKDLYAMAALQVLMEYLTDTSVAPLQRDFVEIKNPFCSKVRYSVIEASESCVYIKFDNVPKDKLSDIKDRLFATLEGMASGKEAVDMERMASVLHRRILECLNHMEERPHDTFAFMGIGDFLYCDTMDELEQRLNQVENYKKQVKESDSFWKELLKRYFISAKSVTILGEPSQKLAESMMEEEKQRIAKQQEELGEAGLKKAADVVLKATEDNETEPPVNMISSFPVPGTDSIHFHPINRHSNLLGNQEAGGAEVMDLKQIPFTFQLDDVHTNFVLFSVLLDTSSVPADLKPYLPLFMEIIFESPVMRDGVLIPYEDVVTQLAADTLSTESSLGFKGARFRCGQFSQLALIEVKVEVEKYTKGVQWLQELLYQTQFVADRLKIVANKMTNDVARLKRDGRTVAVAALRELNYVKESNFHVTSMMRQQKFLSSVVETLDKDPVSVIEDMKSLREVLTSPDNLRIHMAADMKKLKEAGDVQLPWQQHFVGKNIKAQSKCDKLGKFASQLLCPASSDAPLGTIVGVGSVESAFLIQTVPCVSSFSDPDLPALMVYMECLCALEGPMWKQIRGLGLAYHYRMYCRPEEGLLYFQLFKCTHVVNAYKQALEIVEGYLSGQTTFDPVQLETAISSVLYEVIEREETVASTSHESLLSYFRETDQNYNRNLLSHITMVTVEDLMRVGERYMQPLFDSGKSRCAVCCQPSKLDEIKEGFKTFGRELTVMPSLEEGFL
ncbi:uncharacterized protein C05D11.1-like [Acanthaster planci]|uniref:Uncharacterized protein C05D11.1-like n=1 Tax=Acanthaster planci TaxID=133434 RepID=A0A8B7XPV0_ACAPL|nr:uncharacterized protein C05D11.1-like [Acanthaster planci]